MTEMEGNDEPPNTSAPLGSDPQQTVIIHELPANADDSSEEEPPNTSAPLGSDPRETVIIHENPAVDDPQPVPIPSNPIQRSSVIMDKFPGSDGQTDTQRSSVIIIQPNMNKAPVPSVSVPMDTTVNVIDTPTIPLETKPRNSALMHKRKNTFEIEGSLFKQNESNWSIIWLIYTFLYWTLLTWIPILVERKFDANLGGFIVWCFGFIGMICTAYTIYIGHYPSGATRENKFDINGIGRITAAILTSTVIIDCCVIVYVSAELNSMDSAGTVTAELNNNVIYKTNLSRLLLHIVHIFWSSLFFYNRFFYNHKIMAIRAFVFEWGDIIWSCIVSFMITEPFIVDKIYFIIVGIALIGWILPMMLIKTWGTRRHVHKVATHLLILDLLTDAPVILALLITQSYKDNVMLWIDLIWKSLKLERSVSLYFVKYYLRRLAKAKKEREHDEEEIVESAEIYGVSLDALTFAWVIFVGLYWSATVLIRCILDNEITFNYEYYTWFWGMTGILCILDTCLAGYSAEKLYGKPFIAVTCLLISIDSVLHAYELLAGIDSKDDIVGEVMMVFHCIALLSSIVFYSHSFKKGIGYSFLLQWIDIILMFVVIEVLNYSLVGDCFSKAICIGYFVVFIVKIIFWFTPIVLGYANNDKGIHTHMVLLDTFTDLPLVVIVILAVNGGDNIHPFIFVDIVFKTLLLLVSYAYHLVISLFLAQCVHKE